MAPPRRTPPSTSRRGRRPRLGEQADLAPVPAPAPPVPVPHPPIPAPSALRPSGGRNILARVRRAIDPELERRYERILSEMDPRDYDPFGFNLAYADATLLAAAFLYRRWFRCRVDGIEQVPPGRALLVANHSGQIPIDGMMIATAMLIDHDPPRLVRSMIERWASTLPFVSTFFARCGQVVGLPENCRLLLERGELILVFPEGVKGISKTFDRAYQLEEFGAGFVRLALENRAPIVPVAVVGAEEQYPSIVNLRRLARWVGAPAIPLTPLMLLGPIGLVPLPTRYHLAFGAPIRLEGDPDEDDERVAEHVRTVRSAVQTLLERTLSTRKGVFR